jgi:hypothetical protein
VLKPAFGDWEGGERGAVLMERYGGDKGGRDGERKETQKMYVRSCW